MSSNGTSRLTAARILMLENDLGDAVLMIRKLAAAGLRLDSDHVRNAREFIERLLLPAQPLDRPSNLFLARGSWTELL
jgi:hypothetical protein